MKKALVLSLVVLFTFGAATFAGMTGTWDAAISIDPGAVIAGNLFVDLTSSVDLDYAIGGWVFGATSGFDRLGWSSMSFDAAGTLGAFSFSATMNFEPRTITSVAWTYPDTLLDDHTILVWDSCWLGDPLYAVYGYGAAFDDLTFIGSVSIAGVSMEALFFLESYAGAVADDPFAFYVDIHEVVVQTDSTTGIYLGANAGADVDPGSGFRYTLSGTAGGLTITSATYFSLNEDFVTDSYFTKDGDFYVDGCALGFTEEFLTIEGFTVGCAEFSVALDILCSGFSFVAFQASNIDLGIWGLVGEFTVAFTEIQKSVDFDLDFDLDVICFEIGTTLDYSDYVVGGFTIDSLVLDTELNGVTLVSTTYFDGSISEVSDPANQVTVLKPRTGIKDGALTTSLVIPSIDASTLVGYYDAVCLDTEYWNVWETFEITVDGDGCCGGAFEFTVETGMGTLMELDAWGWNYQFEEDALAYETVFPIPEGTLDTNIYETLIYYWLESGDAIPTVDELFGVDATVDIDKVNTTPVWGATAQHYEEQLLVASLYEAKTSNSLFSWVYTNVDLSVGLSAAWNLVFGAAIDVYGWNELTFGFDFSF